jgi:hypothetical protein
MRIGLFGKFFATSCCALAKVATNAAATMPAHRMNNRRITASVS